jgi:hypothetical protein
MIRTNNRENGAVTIEAAKKGAKANLGKLTTVLKDELNVKPSKVNDIKNSDKYQVCVDKINEFLGWFKIIYESKKSDLIICKLLSSCGYPIANKESGETKLMTAPIIKIS